MSVGNIEVFDPTTGNWNLYIERLEQYFLINDVKEHLKVPTLITLMGGTAYELLVTLCAPQKPSTMTLKDVVKTMSDHFYPKPYILAQRYNFRQRKQYKGETISNFAAELKKLAMKCEYKVTLDENLRDQLVSGLICETTRQRLFDEDELDFRTALAIAHSLEAGEEPSNESYDDDDDKRSASRSDFRLVMKGSHGLDTTEGRSGDSYDGDEVPISRSDESESEDESKPKKLKTMRIWMFLNKFSNLKEAEEFVKSENTWSSIFTRPTKEGLKRFYRCNKVKRRGRQCAAQMCLLFVNGSDDVLAYRTDADHNHDEIESQSKCGIPHQTKLALDKLLDQRLKPRSILHALGKMDGIKLPTKIQLNRYLNHKRNAKIGNTSLTIYLSESEKEHVHTNKN